MAANPLDNNGAGKEERREEQAAPEVVHEGEIGRGERPAGCNGDWRGEGQPGRRRIRRQGEASCSVCRWHLARLVEFSGERTESSLCK